MTIAAVTHFCGDPFITLFWVHMYKKYWQHEVDRLYVYNTHNPTIVPSELIELQTKVLSDLPRVVLFESNHPQVPEITNSFLAKQVKEDITFFIESDSWVFRPNFLTPTLFDPIKDNHVDLVGSDYVLFPSRQFSPYPECSGLMRNILACKTDILQKTDLDFLPHNVVQGETINGFTIPQSYGLDCFGWMSLQLLTLTKRISLMPYSNMIDSITNKLDFEHYPFIHVRQFSSSYLGFTSPIWKAIQDNNKFYIDPLVNEAKLTPTYSAPRWHLAKGIAFRWIFTDFFALDSELADFRREYLAILDKTIELTKLDRSKIATLRDHYRNLLQP